MAFTQPAAGEGYVVEYRHDEAASACERDTLIRYTPLPGRTTDPAVMERILGDMAAAAPAERFGLHLAFHAKGWLPASIENSSWLRSSARRADDLWRKIPGAAETRWFGHDRGRYMDISELAAAIDGSGVRFDYLLFDACFMSSVEALYDLLVERGLGEVVLIDFTVMSSFDYYTGIVFEAYEPGLGSPIGGGGRYDNLVAAYGGAKVPAAGFSFYLEQVMEAFALEKAAAPHPLRIAVPKGSLNEDAIAALDAAGLNVDGLADAGRALMLRNGDVEYIIVRPTDAPVFVALGAADCGICGEDSLVEARTDVVELVDLEFGGCRFVVAESAGTSEAVEKRYRELGSMRIATKYPHIARSHFDKQGKQVEIVKLHGNIELAPITGMAEQIVDITATGTTLRENNLVVVEDVLASTARFFANPCSYRTNPRVAALAQALRQANKEN